MDSPIPSKSNSSVDASEFLNFSNTIGGKQIYRDVKILPDRTPCQRKPVRASYRPLALKFQTHSYPKGDKIRFDSESLASQVCHH